MSPGPLLLASRSLFGRFTVAIAAIAAAAMLLVLFAADVAVRQARDDALAQTVDTDLAGLADIYASGGAAELSARIRDRLALLPEHSDAPHYLLTDASGRRIAGDIAVWPALAAETSESGYVTIEGGANVFGRATLLGPGVRLAVAREYGGWDDLAARMRTALLVSGLFILLAVTAAGLWAALRLRRRVAAINQAYQAIERGELDRRAPGADRSDELGELAAHANRMLARIEALVRAHRDISDHVAHELRTPLTHLDNRLLKLIDRSPGSEAASLLGAAREEIRNVVRMLASLLDISASEARRGDSRGLDNIDLSSVVANVAELYADAAEEQGVDFSISIEPDVKLLGDPMQLSRMLTNLLDNALKAAPATHGTISLSLTHGPRIEVTDNGPGVPEEMRTQIFDRFQRLPATGGKGHGLGLALARAIAERHGLTIRVEDSLPGARFIVERQEEP